MKREPRYERQTVQNRAATVIYDLADMDLKDTLECGQAFRYELIAEEAGYVEYLTVIYGRLIRLAQRQRGELIVFSESDDDLRLISDYFRLDLDWSAIREMISSRTDSDWMRRAADAARGIHILKQDPWEALFSFIISQNNNIPRIRKIIRRLSAEYGENLAIKEGEKVCPKGLCAEIDESVCRGCGICYSFPTAEAVAKNPEGLNAANPGFRYKYLVDAASRVYAGECKLDKIQEKASFHEIAEELKAIKGVGDKVASCVALFGMGRLEAFPIDVWMKRAIDEYFGGNLDHTVFGDFAGVAQQYIFHYIRNLNGEKN